MPSAEPTTTPPPRSPTSAPVSSSPIPVWSPGSTRSRSPTGVHDEIRIDLTRESIIGTFCGVPRFPIPNADPSVVSVVCPSAPSSHAGHRDEATAAVAVASSVERKFNTSSDLIPPEESMSSVELSPNKTRKVLSTDQPSDDDAESALSNSLPLLVPGDDAIIAELSSGVKKSSHPKSKAHPKAKTSGGRRR